jgi:2,3-bisphosphoglycerate-dependent phosphoglycerate mutase
MDTEKQHRLILLRHGQSAWNLEDRFTGWTDIDLTEAGREEARRAGMALRAHGVRFDVCYTSVLRRAIHTAWIVLDATDSAWRPLIVDWRLNERHYGALQGLNKAETAARYGAAQVQTWRRGYAVRPPPLPPGDARAVAGDPRYAGLDPAALPATESLQDTQVRVLRAWEERIAPDLRAGHAVLIVAHGNSLRALVKYLENIGDQAVEALNIATGRPIVYRLDAELRVVGKQDA